MKIKYLLVKLPILLLALISVQSTLQCTSTEYAPSNRSLLVPVLKIGTGLGMFVASYALARLAIGAATHARDLREGGVAMRNQMGLPHSEYVVPLIESASFGLGAMSMASVYGAIALINQGNQELSKSL